VNVFRPKRSSQAGCRTHSSLLKGLGVDPQAYTRSFTAKWRGVVSALEAVLGPM
jgi:hypothetical protein